MGLSTYAAITLISKQIGEVKKCGATDISPEFPGHVNYLSQFGAKMIFNGAPPDDMRAAAVQLIRRADMALAEYGQAVRELTAMVAEGSWSPYFRAVFHFEVAVGQMYQAYEYAVGLLGEKLFTSKDGSPLERLNKVYNTSKHQRAQLDQPVWITDDGLAIEGAELLFTEIEDMLRQLSRIAKRIATTA